MLENERTIFGMHFCTASAIICIYNNLHLLISRWSSRSHGEVSFPAAAAHGYFDCYLHRINRMSPSVYTHCRVPSNSSGEKDSAYHNLCDARYSRAAGKHLSARLGLVTHTFSFASCDSPMILQRPGERL